MRAMRLRERRRRAVMVLGAAAVMAALMIVLGMALMSALVETRVRSGRLRLREQRAMRPLFAMLRSAPRTSTASDALEVWHVEAPGVGTLVVVRAGRGRGAAIYEGSPARARGVWEEGEEHAREWARREAERVAEAGGYAQICARSGLDARAASVIGGQPAGR